jgi:hypothetical protein
MNFIKFFFGILINIYRSTSKNQFILFLLLFLLLMLLGVLAIINVALPFTYIAL